jgi:hypothetical protein
LETGNVTVGVDGVGALADDGSGHGDARRGEEEDAVVMHGGEVRT